MEYKSNISLILYQNIYNKTNTMNYSRNKLHISTHILPTASSAYLYSIIHNYVVPGHMSCDRVSVLKKKVCFCHLDSKCDIRSVNGTSCEG